MASKINIRQAEPRDFPALGKVFFAAVREGAALYSPAERAAWAKQLPTGEAWANRLAAQHVMLAETETGEPVGFASMDANGYADFAYILRDYQGQGLFRKLYEPLEGAATQRGIDKFSTHASLHARPAFEAVGYTVTTPEIVELGDERIERFHMHKRL